MSSLAVVGTFYRRPWAVPRIAEEMRAATRKPDQLWLVIEDLGDFVPIVDPEWGVIPYILPYRGDAENPMAGAINLALDHLEADYVAYLTDDSLPHPDKYRLMAQALDENPEWGAVYCSQDYGRATGPEDWLAGGTHHTLRRADRPQPAPFAVVDHTQVMHRRSPDRWPTGRGDRLTADGVFFRLLVERSGPLMPIDDRLDWTRQLPDGLSSR